MTHTRQDLVGIVAAAIATVVVGTLLLMAAILIGKRLDARWSEGAIVVLLLAGYAWGRFHEMAIKDRHALAALKSADPAPLDLPIPTPAPAVALAPRTTLHTLEVAVTHLTDGTVRIERIADRTS